MSTAGHNVAAPPRGRDVELVIRPREGWIGIDWRELKEYRELLYFLVWRDVKVRYKQTVLGVAWAVLQPLVGMLIFTLIFGRLANMPSDGFPYGAFVYAGLLPWTFFSNAVSQGGLSLVNQQHLMTKVYFPRMFVPASSVGERPGRLLYRCDRVRLHPRRVRHRAGVGTRVSAPVDRADDHGGPGARFSARPL